MDKTDWGTSPFIHTCQLKLGSGVLVFGDNPVLSLVTRPDLADLESVNFALAQHLVFVALDDDHVVPHPFHLDPVLVQFGLKHNIRARRLEHILRWLDDLHRGLC